KLSENLERAKTKFEHAMASAMYSAARNGHTDLIKQALEKKFIHVNQSLILNTTLLSSAAEREQHNLMQFLLDNEAEPEPALSVVLGQLKFITRGSERENRLEKSAFILLNAIEKRGELKSTDSLTQALHGGKLDILKRLFDLDQGRLIKIDTIATLLQQARGDCKEFLQEKLAQAQSATVLEASAEEQSFTSKVEAEEPFHFFESSSAVSQLNAVDQDEECSSNNSSAEAENPFRFFESSGATSQATAADQDEESSKHNGVFAAK
ncbi:hypothetical protein, partial [Legionella nautarum]